MQVQGNTSMTDDHLTRRVQSLNNKQMKWRKIKIYFDLTKLNSDLREHWKGNSRVYRAKKAFYKKVFNVTRSWWEQAVWIKDDHRVATKEIKDQIDAGNIDPFHFQKGKGIADYDMLIHAHMTPNDGGTLAWAGPLYRHPDNQRPITGEAAVCYFGDKNFFAGSDRLNRAIGTIVHEFGHALAFIQLQEFHGHYTAWNPKRKTWVWSGPTAVKNYNTYLDCDTATDGHRAPHLNLQMMSRTEAGAHWQEVAFADELMTPFAGQDPETLSPMTLGLIEDTKWYKANYRMTENYHHNFKNNKFCHQKQLTACPDPPVCAPNTDGFVTSDFKGIGYCERDESNCWKETKYSNRDTS